MTDLVNQRFADDRADLVFIAVAVVLDRPLKDGDDVGQAVTVSGTALGQRRALVESEQRVGRLDLHLLE